MQIVKHSEIHKIKKGYAMLVILKNEKGRQICTLSAMKTSKIYMYYDCRLAV